MLSGTIRSVKQGEVLFFMHTSPLKQELFPLTIHLYIPLTQSYFCMLFLLIVIMQIFHSPVLNLVRMSLIKSWSKSNWLRYFIFKIWLHLYFRDLCSQSECTLAKISFMKIGNIWKCELCYWNLWKLNFEFWLDWLHSSLPPFLWT